MGNWKKSIIQGAICIGLLCVIWGGYFLTKHFGADRVLDINADDFSWVYQVDSAEVEDGDFVLRGFAFELDKDATEGAFEIVLQDIESGKRYFPKMEYTERSDVNEYFLCEYDYLQTGFEAAIKAKKLDLDEKNYEVLLRRADERQTYQTGTYISKGELMYTNPQGYEPLDVEGTNLEKIVEEGILRVYRPEYGMYVYQYDGNLYWIADEMCKFLDKDSTYIDVMVQTTQPQLLPENRKKYGNDNLDFVFQNSEFVEISGYRVSKKKIPSEYSITYFLTGHRENSEWVWKDNFRIFYSFPMENVKK